MQLLKELLSLQESPDVPIELKDIVNAFPRQHGKAISKLWGTRRLVWHGMRFFDHKTLGEAYTKSEEAVEEYMDREDLNVELSFQLDASKIVVDNDEDDDAPGYADVEISHTLEYKDMQECYLGYSPKKDKLYIGFDAWGGNDEEFNEAFEKAFEEATGLHFDDSNEEHQEVYTDVWHEYGESGAYGVIFEITDVHGEFDAEPAMAVMPGGFYRGVYTKFKRTHSDVVDLRLD